MISTTKRVAASILLVSVLAATTARVFAAEDPAATAPAHTLYGDPAVADISGLWTGTYTASPGYPPQQPIAQQDRTHWAPWPPPLTPDYQKLADERIAAAKAGRAIGDIGAKCLPFGMPFVITNGGYPNEIIQTPGVVAIFIYGSFPIMVWTDGRPHPKDLKPSYNGHTTGYWVGTTLYTDTVGILNTTPIDSGPRTPHSNKLDMKMAIHLVAPDVLHVTVTLFDEDALTEPMVTTNIWRRRAGPVWQALDDGSCFENNRNKTDASGATGFIKF